MRLVVMDCREWGTAAGGRDGARSLPKSGVKPRLSNLYSID